MNMKIVYIVTAWFLVGKLLVIIITLQACARGKAISMSVICLPSALKSPDLNI